MKDKKFKVLHFLATGKIGGMEKALYQLLKAFNDDEEFEVGLATGDNKGFFIEKIKNLNLPILYFDIRNGFSSSFKAESYRQMKNYQIHHFHDPSPVYMLQSILAGTKIKRVVTRRGGFFDYSRLGLKSAIKHFIIKAFYKNFFSGFSGNTKHAADFLRKYYGILDTKIHVLYNGFDPILLKPSLDKKAVCKYLNVSPSGFKVGTSCHLIKCKRVDLLIRSFSLSEAKNKVLIIFGKGPELNNLQKLAKSLNIANEVKFIGEVKDIEDYMQVLDCFVLPSGKGESFGNALVEAMAMEIPSIIMADGGGMKEHIIDRETGFTAHNEQDLAKIIDFIFCNPERSKEIARQAAAYVKKKYSISNMLSCYKKFYKEVLFG